MQRYNIQVQHQHLGYQPDKSYDLSVLLLVHYAGKYKQRLDAFKAAGLYNVDSRAVHLVLVASPGDWKRREEILAGWPAGMDITLLEMGSHHPIPKVNGYYLWLKENQIRSNWYLRIDDDSVTDLGACVDYAEANYAGLPVHLMTFPLFFPEAVRKYVPYLKHHGLRIPTITHEHESSLTSHQAMQGVFECEQATEFLAYTGASFECFGDQPLALAMHIARVPVATNPISSRDFLADQLTLTGGRYAHIHYVDWNNESFAAALTAVLAGTTEAVTQKTVETLLDRPLNFGRCFGVSLGDLTLRADGSIEGNNHPNESRWRFEHGILALQRPSGLATTVFRSLRRHEGGSWLMGPYLSEPHQHYLRVS